MDTPFDTTKADEKLESAREREEEDLARILSEKYGLSYVNLSVHEIDADALRIIPEKEAHEAEAIAFAKANRVLSVALQNPNNPAFSELAKKLEARNYKVKGFLVSRRSMEKGFSRYKDISLAEVSQAGGFSIKNEIQEMAASGEGAFGKLKSVLEEMVAPKTASPTSRLLETIFAGAFVLRASDIHFEPEEEKTRLRFRIDGLLTDVFFFDPKIYHQILSRLKILSAVKLNISDRAQDGRFSVDRGDTEIEVRSSFIPGNYGESVVMRLLDPAQTQVSYRELGMQQKLLTRLETEIRRANGMLLTTGPTGSGKTTTLYSFLREIQSPEIKIITIEDPIEYHLDGIVQTQVDSKYTFAEGLRSIVRQDPDIIMVGEIRDNDTAGIAIEAALTGHFVFSTLHTNDAAGTFPRLVDLGADPKAFGSAVTVSMAQRLVRKLNPNTKKERPLTDDEKKMIEKLFETVADPSLIPKNRETVWEPTVAEGDTGYHGRVGLYEAIFMDDELARFLRDNPPSHDIAAMATKQGYLTMAQDGVVKALEGVTSLSEVASIVDLPRV